MVTQGICEFRINHLSGQNISLEEKKAIKQLQTNPAFLVKEADKGGGGDIVLWPINTYLEEAHNQ